MKVTKFAIAVALRNPKDGSKVLAVKRPADDESLPDVWGLPAVVVRECELPEAAVSRLGREKLDTDIRPVSYVGIRSTERENYELILMVCEAELVGLEPSVVRATTDGTKYVDQQWTDQYEIFKEAASKGSLCSRIFLESIGMKWD